MSMMYLGLWLQQDDAGGTRHLVVIILVLVAAAICVMAIATMYIGLKALKAIKEVSAAASEAKIKILPLLDELTAISKTSRVMLEDAAPKIKTISENLRKTSEILVETSGTAKATVHHVQSTILDANMRTQRQVARVDTMVSAALATTQEVADTIFNGIRVPAIKLAGMLNQAKGVAEGLMARVKGINGAAPFGSTRRPE